MIFKIKKKTNDFTMESLYKYVGTSRQNLHYSRIQETKNELMEQEIIEIIKNYREEHPRMGSRQLFHTLKNSGEDIGIGITKFEQLLSRTRMTVAPMRSRQPKTSDGKGKEQYSNLTNGLIINDINQLIVGDITYFATDDGMCFIFTLKDVYSQRILGLVPSMNMYHENALKCLDQMCEYRNVSIFPNCIHHSDNGSQYNARDYKTRLQGMKLVISRAEGCVENGSCEQLNHIIKNMYLTPWGIKTYAELKKGCKRMMDLNNNHRAIKQLGNLSPKDFETKIRSMPQKDKPVKNLYDFNNWT